MLPLYHYKKKQLLTFNNMDSENLFVIICRLLNSLKRNTYVFKKQELRRKITKLYVLYSYMYYTESQKWKAVKLI